MNIDKNEMDVILNLLESIDWVERTKGENDLLQKIRKNYNPPINPNG